MEDLKVQKAKLEAQIAIRGKKLFRGSFFVVPSAYPVPNSYLMLQLLNESHDFIPLERTKKIILLNKHQIIFLKLAAEKLAETEAGVLQRKVRILLPTRQEILGMVFIDLPEERQRVLDFLNLKADFFLVIGRREAYIINKSMVQEITPVD